MQEMLHTQTSCPMHRIMARHKKQQKTKMFRRNCALLTMIHPLGNKEHTAKKVCRFHGQISKNNTNLRHAVDTPPATTAGQAVEHCCCCAWLGGRGCQNLQCFVPVHIDTKRPNVPRQIFACTHGYVGGHVEVLFPGLTGIKRGRVIPKLTTSTTTATTLSTTFTTNSLQRQGQIVSVNSR